MSLDDGSVVPLHGAMRPPANSVDAAPSPAGEELEAGAVALHRQGDVTAAVDQLERAFTAYRHEGRPLDASRIARTRAYQCYLDGDHVLVGGWLSRARRLAGDDRRERLWIEVFDAMDDPNPVARDRRLRMVEDAARDLGDADLEYDALGVRGMYQVLAGEVEEGMTLLDESLTAVCAGDVQDFVVVEGACCLLFTACEAALDVDRAEQWMAGLDGVIAITGLPSLRPICLNKYGGILSAAGRYEEADAALTDVMRHPQRGYVLARHNAAVRLADVRLRQGRYEEAAQLLNGLEEHPDAAQSLAWLHLLRGDLIEARDRIQRTLSHTVGVPHGRLLALRAEVELAVGDVDTARDVAAQLAARVGVSHYLAALSRLTDGRTQLAAGEAAAAATSLREAVTGFAEARMPLELVAARIALARTMAADFPQVAVTEAKRALERALQIGAARFADEAGALLRELGHPLRVGDKGGGELTARESEVLDLVGHGLSNLEIAERLVISRKTVEHHVSRVLMKLGVRNRTEAAAWAVRTGLARTGSGHG